mmetsp:Transcript_124361/g.387175  ORF Transcript_124361/g.387175 Transcript_124361/m.387175 type:complete len:419 (-) Transcript_124361:410-1666(-)
MLLGWVDQRTRLLQETLQVCVVCLVLHPVFLHDDLKVQPHWPAEVDGLRDFLLSVLSDVPQLAADDFHLTLRPNDDLLAQQQCPILRLTPHGVDDCQMVGHLLPADGEELLAGDLRGRHARGHVTHSLHGEDGALPGQVFTEPNFQWHQRALVVENRSRPQVLQQRLVFAVGPQILVDPLSHHDGKLLDVHAVFSQNVDFVQHNVNRPPDPSELPEQGQLLLHLRVQPPVVLDRRSDGDAIQLGTGRHEVAVGVALPSVKHPPDKLNVPGGLPSGLDHGLVELAVGEELLPLALPERTAGVLRRRVPHLHDARSVDEDRLRVRHRPGPGSQQRQPHHLLPGGLGLGRDDGDLGSNQGVHQRRLPRIRHSQYADASTSLDLRDVHTLRGAVSRTVESVIRGVGIRVASPSLSTRGTKIS